jgi:hypothetical protein
VNVAVLYNFLAVTGRQVAITFVTCGSEGGNTSDVLSNQPAERSGDFFARTTRILQFSSEMQQT